MNKKQSKNESAKSPAPIVTRLTSVFRDSGRKTTMIAARESAVLTVGCLAAYCFVIAQGLFDGAFIFVMMAISLPIAFCLLRTAVASYPRNIGPVQQVAWHLCISLAFVMLFLFEMSFAALLAGKRVAMLGPADDIPAIAWGIAVVFAVAYIGLFCLAHCVAYRWGREVQLG